jgi:hypothetical protein
MRCFLIFTTQVCVNTQSKMLPQLRSTVRKHAHESKLRALKFSNPESLFVIFLRILFRFGGTRHSCLLPSNFASTSRVGASFIRIFDALLPRTALLSHMLVAPVTLACQRKGASTPETTQQCKLKLPRLILWRRCSSEWLRTFRSPWQEESPRLR